MNNSHIFKFEGYMIKEADQPKEKDTKIPLYLSADLSKILKKIISEPIAKKLLDSEFPLDISSKFDLSYLDISEDSKNISYFPIERLDRISIDTKFPSNTGHEVWKSKFRQSMTWGKIINKLFPGEFTNMDIDRFYNRYRPEIDVKEKESSRFKVVHGEDIRYWYLASRWDGQFGSCMQGESKQPYFDIYCKNPDKCGLLIYFSQNKPDKIIGRALVWNNLLKPSGDTAEDKSPYTLLDRVYFVSENQNQIQAAFHKYAIDHGWIYKSGDQFLLNGVRKTTSVATRLNPVDHKYYPYVDTMAYYTPATGRAASTPGNPGRDPQNPSKTFPRYSLKNQDGSKSSLDR